MNRMWLRFSLTITAIVLLVAFVPLIFNLIQVYFGLNETPPEFAAILPDDVIVSLQEIALSMIPVTLVRLGFAAAVVGIITGVVLSHNLTAPLQQLQAAAEEIGAQNLSRRVDLSQGSDEIKAVAAAFNDMASKLESAESMRQNLLADVAHELRTPLTILQGNLRAILDDVYPLEKEEIARIYEQTRHLTHLVNDLHELAQAEAERLPLHEQDLSVARIVQEAAAVFEPLVENKGLTLRVELLGRMPKVHADKARLTQALHNLISNAIEHTPQGGIVTVQAEHTEEGLQLRVIDTGVGLTTEHLDHVFDRFYRTDRSRSRNEGGTGLGLAIVRAFIEAHNGHVTVHSDGAGHGTTFVVTLPTANE